MSTTNEPAALPVSVRTQADFFAEQAVLLLASQQGSTTAERKTFILRIIQPIYAQFGWLGVGVLVHSLAKLAHYAADFLAEDKGLTIEQVLDTFAENKGRPLEVSGLESLSQGES